MTPSNPSSLEEDTNRISQMLFGHREASQKQIFTRIEALVEMERSLDTAQKARGDRIRAALDELTEALALGE
jgi:hypothetical protein